MTEEEEQELVDWYRTKHGVTDTEPPKPQVLHVKNANSSGEALAETVATEVKAILAAVLMPIVRRLESVKRDVGTLPRVARELRATIDKFHGHDVETRFSYIERRLRDLEPKK